MKEVLSNEALLGPLKTATAVFNWMGEQVPMSLLTVAAAAIAWELA